MRRVSVAALATLASVAALPALAQDGGPIRTGEHIGYTRVVMTIDPTTEWSLETAPGAATIFFPGRRLEFGTAGVFDRIPRTRVTGIRTEITGAGTRVDVQVNCDCRISASFVGARHLALDVGDRTATPRAETAALPAPEARPEPSAAEEAGPAPRPAEENMAADAGIDQATLEADVIASAESMLLRQLSRAADQGIVEVAPDQTLDDPEPVAAVRPAETAVPDPEAPLRPAPRPAPAPEAAEAVPAPAPAEDVAPETLAELMLLDQIEAMTVFDRDSASLAERRPVRREAVPEPCVADDALDVGRWTNGTPLHAQTPQLMRGIVGEFDKPDPRALRDLARLYVRFGFGAEAESLLAAFDADFPDRAMLTDLARAVEGRPVDPEGPLALDVVCPGRHGLWMALGGAAPAFVDEAHFATVLAAFADMPPDLRSEVGPALITRLVEAGRPKEARLVEVTLTRPGVAPTDALELAGARLLAAEGETRAALTELNALATSNAWNAVDALIAMTRLALDEGLAVPDRTLVDLSGAALQQRGDPREAQLRALLVEALAQRGALAESVREVRAAQADLPDAAEAFGALGQEMLGEADPERVGAAAYAETVLDAGDLIGEAPEADATRAAVAARMIDVGLANAALAMLAPPLSRGKPESRLLAARAHLTLGDTTEALVVLDGVAGPEALRLRAEALARGGRPDDAVALLDAAGADASPYAWTSGAWDRVSAGDADPARRTMARFMASRTGEAPPPVAPDAAAPTPEAAAFEAPVPPLDTPSLGAGRTLLDAAGGVGGFLGGLLSADAGEEAPAP